MSSKTHAVVINGELLKNWRNKAELVRLIEARGYYDADNAI